ncbi:polysaccharide deacetylase family protein [Tsuneonella sp. YG55]|uniref:Polysaccharide deacetylase family protein n=1 Tax=Tsuneonella litorea TaxID=2976475 RepID=A0A9X2W3A9_9SPHN|nr:polysaccharide deacetylase family protein [Tsuneonella litorea]MCT2559799.1 polysaccharide deacetylase family protein [Tsuneonella litorea]
MDRPITEPPPQGRAAQFGPEFGQRVLLTVDTEEEFDWSGPFTRDAHGLSHVEAIPRFQAFCEDLGVVPVYLVDWPIATDARAVEVIGSALRGGRAEVGIQLHPWVNPPFEEDVSLRNSFAGNLPPALEREKFLRLRDAIADAFGTDPLIYRAGRYGLGPQTATLLREAGVPIDSSVRANYDYSAGHGPDYSRHPLAPYWVDAERNLLELPLTTVHFGMLRKQGRALQPLLARAPRAAGVLSRLGLLERIALTPEGVTAEEALRGIDIALDDGLPLLVLSFHSPSLATGHTPYVRSEADLERLYDWFDRIYAYLEMRGVAPTTVAEIIDSVRR